MHSTNDNHQPTNVNHRWPEGAIVYHIYPRSLQDSNGDGVGDLRGIIERLDHLESLQVNALWLSPFYPSPMADFGYDVADYCAVHPLFGTMDDFKALLQATHERGMQLIVDLVPNHTSDEHPWFQASRQSRDNPYADWYIWRDAADDDDPTYTHPYPPNNWRDALTGRSAWEWDETRQQFYLHSFHTKQPDLNWSNPVVREAIKDAMRFWLDLGVDGFRVDAVYWMAKNPLFRDDAPNPEYVSGEDSPYEALIHDNSRGWPAVYAYLAELATVLKEDQFSDRERFMITEAYPERHNPIDAYMAFYEGVDPTVAAPFNFEGVELAWQAGEWRRFLKTFHCALSELHPASVASYAFGNHDKPRLASRLGDAAARSAAVMLFTLPGMVFLYYGEEIGMHSVQIPPERIQDPAAKGDPLLGQGRDPARTPMQWDSTPHAGFSTAAETWLPVSPDYETSNVAVQSTDPHSFLSLYRTLAGLRSRSDALRYGTIEVIDANHPDVLAYLRHEKDEHYLVLVNFSSELVACRPAGAGHGELLVSSDAQTKLTHASKGDIELLPNEAALFLWQV